MLESDLDLPMSQACTHQVRLGHRAAEPWKFRHMCASTTFQTEAPWVKSLALSCMHWDTQPVPRVRIKIHSNSEALTMTDSVLKSLRVPLLVGRNCLGLDRLYNSAVRKMYEPQLMAVYPLSYT